MTAKFQKNPILVIITISCIVIILTAGWNYISSTILSNTVIGLYSRNFFENVLVEAHGMLLDLFVVVLALGWLEKKKQRIEDITSLNHRLEAVLCYRGQDASRETFLILRNLLAQGENKIRAPGAALNSLVISDAILEKSNFIGANFSDSIIKDCSFTDCNLEAGIFINAKINRTKFKGANIKRANFRNAKLDGFDFTSCEVVGAKFTGASLRNADFRGVDCSSVDFTKADLSNANFKNARNLSPSSLNQAANIKYIKQ